MRIIIIFYTAFSVYTVPLIDYLLSNKFPPLYTIIFVVFLILFIVSLVFGILLLLPQGVAFKELPKCFYTETRKQYEEEKQVPDDMINLYIQETYLRQLEECVDLNFKLNNKKSKYHHWAFRLAIYAIIPYSICVGYSIFTKQDNPIKIEIVKSNINLNDSIMCKNEKNEKGEKEEKSVSPKFKIDKSLVLKRDPQIIKEGKEKSSKLNTGKCQFDKE